MIDLFDYFVYNATQECCINKERYAALTAAAADFVAFHKRGDDINDGTVQDAVLLYNDLYGNVTKEELNYIKKLVEENI